MALQRIWKNFDARTIEVCHQLIVNASGESSGKPARQSGSASISGEDCVAMHRACAGLLAGQECCADLRPFSTQSKSSHDAPCIADTTCSDDGNGDGIGDQGDEREGTGQRLFSREKKGAAMSARFEAGSDDQVNACLFESDGFVGCGRRADGHDALRTAFVKDLPLRNAGNEAEGGYVCIEQHAHLILKANGNVGFVIREGAAQRPNVPGQRRQAAGKCISARGARALVFH